MTFPVLPSVKKLCLEPGILFPIANLFAFMQSGNRLAIALAAANIIIAGFATLRPHNLFPPLRILGLMVLLSGLCSLESGAILPGLAGLAFATGALLNSSNKIMASLNDPTVAPSLKVATHPAIYYGIGYCMTGLMAGGGLRLLAHPLESPQALTMVSVGAAAILIASLGLALGFLKAAIPFWILAGGGGINTLAGICSGNFIGAASCLFSTCGELRLGWMTHEASKQGNNHGL